MEDRRTDKHNPLDTTGQGAQEALMVPSYSKKGVWRPLLNSIGGSANLDWAICCDGTACFGLHSQGKLDGLGECALSAL